MMAIYGDLRTLTSSQPVMGGARLISQHPATSKAGDRVVVAGAARSDLLGLLGGGFRLVGLVDPFAAGPFPFETVDLT